jgi:hypothetical protein
MAVQLASNIAPKNGQTYYMMEDVYLKGGLQVRDNITDRDSIAIANLKLGALVLTVDTGKIWKVKTLVQKTPQDSNVQESVTWEELLLGGTPDDEEVDPGEVQRRAVVIHTIDNLTVDSSEEFSLELGTSAIILKLTVSRAVRVRAYSTPLKDESNPYEFLATDDHLTDDGSQKLSDGTIFRTRNYSILANFEEPAKNDIYFTIDNVGEAEGPVTLTITYVPLEAAAE